MAVVAEFAANSVDHLQFAWQWSPWVVAGLAAVAVIMAAASLRHRRGLPGMRLIAFAARAAAITMLVVMLSGWNHSPKGMPERATEPFVPSLAVRTPRIVRLGDAVGIDIEARLPPAGSGGRTATADLVGPTGDAIASASLFKEASVAGRVEPEVSRRGERVRGRIIWRPESTGAFSGSVRIRGEEVVPSAAVSLQVADEPLRVLLLDRPRFESRFLSQLLSRDARIAVTERLQRTGSPISGPAASPGGLAEIPATREAWNQFDAVAIGAIDPLSIPEPAAAALVEAAANDGIGIFWILDAASDPEAIAVSPLGRLLPFRGVSRQPPFTTACAIDLADTGEEAAWLAVADDAAVSREAWRTMPSVYGAAVPTAVRPTARVMATCQPAAKDGGDRGPESPFILVDRAGDSRIVAFLAETWRLRQGARGPFVDRILSQAILHAAEPHFASRHLGDTPSGPQTNRGAESIAGAEAARGGTPTSDLPDKPAIPSGADAGMPATRRPPWSHPAILVTLLAACGIEWWIRERLGEGP